LPRGVTHILSSDSTYKYVTVLNESVHTRLTTSRLKSTNKLSRNLRAQTRARQQLTPRRSVHPLPFTERTAGNCAHPNISGVDDDLYVTVLRTCATNGDTAFSTKHNFGSEDYYQFTARTYTKYTSYLTLCFHSEDSPVDAGPVNSGLHRK